MPVVFKCFHGYQPRPLYVTMLIPSFKSILHTSLIPPSSSAASSTTTRWFDDTRMLPRIDTRSLALLVTILLHILLLWIVVTRSPLELKPTAGSRDGAITYIAPLASAPPERKPAVKPTKVPAKPKPKPPPTPKTLAKRDKPKPITPRDAPPSLAIQQLTPAPNLAPQQDVARAAPEEDFASRLEANRKRRAESQPQDPAVADAAPAETESQRANRIAKDNVAFSRRRGAVEQDQNGGVFDVRNVHLHTAEFAFHGWSSNTSRNSTQVVAVEQGNEIDIEMAVVKRLVVFIRAMKPAEFVFESRRLGRSITLNAGVAYQAELERFLLREFFPTYVRTAGR